MSDSPALALSPSFERARTLSSVLRWFFIINFGMTALWLVSVPLALIWPQAAQYNIDGSLVSLAGQPMPGRLYTAAAIIVRALPALVLLYHAIKVFSGFARGEVFATGPIAHIRACGFWIIIWAFAPSAAQLILEHHVRIKFEPALLAFGVATFIAAYVMGEGVRIANENASIL